jgi:ABC-type glycerol-3-phosphate transport system permease component
MATRTATLTQALEFTRTPGWRHAMVIVRRVLLYAVLIGAALFFLFPMAWMIGTSLKTIEEIGRPQISLIPSSPQWENYDKLLHEDAFYRSYTNSIFITTMVVVGTTASVSLVAFSFSRLEWKGRGIVFALMMSTLMLPYQTTLVPQYVIFHKLHWIRTFNPITLPGFFAGGASLIFLLRQFMLGIPKELDEAAMIDGANPFQIFLRIIMPQSLPAVVVVGLTHIVFAWNDFFNPFIYLLGQEDKWPISIGIQQYNYIFGTQPNMVQAISLLGLSLPVILFFLAQRVFMQGVVITGVEK